MNTSDKKYTIKREEDFPAYFDFSSREEQRPDGTTVKIEYTKLLNGEVLESEDIIENKVNPSINKHSSANKQPSTKKQPSIKKQSSTNKLSSTKKQPSTNKLSSTKKQSSTKKLSSGKTSKKRTKKNPVRAVLTGLTVITLIIFLCCAIILVIRQNSPDFMAQSDTEAAKPSLAEGLHSTDDTNNADETLTADSTEGTNENTPDFLPHPVESTLPSNYVTSEAINVDGVNLNGQKYTAPEEISFGLGKDYFPAEGVITFRGNNFRNDPTFGYANLRQHQLNAIWSVPTGSLSHEDAVWTGSGWTGQPLIRKWNPQQKIHMNMYDWAKSDDDLVEVIYACMDGNIYFLDLKTGQQTRDTLSLGFTFKGSGALDPRGYPIMYLGAGYDSQNGRARVFVINLFDCSVMYTFGNNDAFSLRGELSYFDSSALVDAETDTLIYPGENGVLYLIHLGTTYNEETGNLSIEPSPIVKWHCNSIRNRFDAFWPGMEDSAVIYKGYLYIMDNGGNFYCLNLNTLELVWVQDCLDDSNGSPVLSIEDEKVYLYASTSFHLGWRSFDTATVPIWKIDAETGEIVWQTDYTCQSMEDLSGGVQSTIAVGRDGLEDSIYVTVSRTGGMYNGVLACMDKKTGNIKWEHNAAYTWSSPVCIYNKDGEGSILYCTSGGKMYLLNGITGEVYDEITLSDGNIEASPAVYEDYAVVGIRACKIWGILLE